MLRDLAVGGGQGDEVHPLEYVANVAPGVVGGVLYDADQEQGEPAQLDVGADAVFAVVEHRPQDENVLHATLAPFDLEQGLVGRGQVVGVRVLSEVRSSHLPSRCDSRLIAAASRRSSPDGVRRR